MISHLQTGDFIDTPRIRRLSIIMLAFALLAVAALFATSDGMRDYQGRPLGTDFSNVYAAGRMAIEGRASEAFNPANHFARQREIFADEAIPLYGWHYPPFFLMVAALLALLPYTASYILWQAATLPLYLRVVSLIAPGRTALLAAAASPAAFVNFTHGQNGFLTAALLGGAMLVLDRRPLAAGVLIGLLAYKPQFGVMIPLVLIATGRWRTFAAAAATLAVLASATTLAFGASVWPAFADNMRFTQTAIVTGGGPGWEKVQSLFAALRAVGVPEPLAMTGQVALATAAAASLVWLWRSAADHAAKAAGLIAASLLATPYALDYDMAALVPAIAFLAANGVWKGFRRFEKTILAFAFLAPLFSRQIAAATFLPLGLLSMAMLYGVALSHGRTRRPAGAALLAAA